MGSGSFNASAYRSFTSSTSTKTRDEIYSSRSIDPSLNPNGVTLRESRDSADNPQSTPVIIAIDVTGSMGILAETIARKGLGTVFNEILSRKPITNPHLMFMAVGDVYCDSAPLQVSQFEADNRIVEQLTKIYLEGGGGGNNSESYNFPWYFAANHTSHDAFVKRAKRGYLFTVGDECAPENLSVDSIKKFLGTTPQHVPANEQLLREVQRTYDVFHIITTEGDYCRQHKNSVIQSWRNLLGQRVIVLEDYTKLAETIVAAIEVAEGRDADKVTVSFGPAVHRAVKNLAPARKPVLSLPAIPATT